MELNIKEDNLNTRKSVIAGIDKNLFKLDPKAFVDGLVKDCDGDEELALRTFQKHGGNEGTTWRNSVEKELNRMIESKKILSITENTDKLEISEDMSEYRKALTKVYNEAIEWLKEDNEDLENSDEILDNGNENEHLDDYAKKLSDMEVEPNEKKPYKHFFANEKDKENVDLYKAFDDEVNKNVSRKEEILARLKELGVDPEAPMPDLNKRLANAENMANNENIPEEQREFWKNALEPLRLLKELDIIEKGNKTTLNKKAHLSAKNNVVNPEDKKADYDKLYNGRGVVTDNSAMSFFNAGIYPEFAKNIPLRFEDENGKHVILVKGIEDTITNSDIKDPKVFVSEVTLEPNDEKAGWHKFYSKGEIPASKLVEIIKDPLNKTWYHEVFKKTGTDDLEVLKQDYLTNKKDLRNQYNVFADMYGLTDEEKNSPYYRAIYRAMRQGASFEAARKLVNQKNNTLPFENLKKESVLDEAETMEKMRGEIVPTLELNGIPTSLASEPFDINLGTDGFDNIKTVELAGIPKDEVGKQLSKVYLKYDGDNKRAQPMPIDLFKRLLGTTSKELSAIPDIWEAAATPKSWQKLNLNTSKGHYEDLPDEVLQNILDDANKDLGYERINLWDEYQKAKETGKIPSWLSQVVHNFMPDAQIKAGKRDGKGLFKVFIPDEEHTYKDAPKMSGQSIVNKVSKALNNEFMR